MMLIHTCAQKARTSSESLSTAPHGGGQVVYQSRYTAGIWQSPAFMDVPIVDISAAQSTEQVPEAITT